MSDDLIAGGPAERCLDELFDRLAGTGAAGRRALAEADDHLRSAVADAVASGAEPEAAERDAVARFGRPAAIAAQLRAADHGIGALVRPLISGAVWVGLVAALALGASGLVSEMLGRVFGAGFVAGNGTGIEYSASRCADFLSYFPNAGGCAGAATLDHWGEVVEYRVALGVLGLLGLGVWALLRRTTRLGEPAWRAPAPVVALVIAGLAGLAGVGLLLLTASNAATGIRQGIGASLADGSVAILVGVGAAIWALIRYRRPEPAVGNA